MYLNFEFMAAYLVEDQKKITTGTLRKMKQEGQKIAMLTSYDFGTARIVDEAGIDIILVGDSAANVMAGHATTLPITVDEMIYHAKCVVRGVKRAFVVCDMPFGSYQISTEDGVRNAVKIMKESGADGVKLEGGAEIIDTVKRIISAGIPVMGHLGLTPQSINVFGNYSVRAKEEAEAQKLIDDAKALEAAGCFAIVVEKIPATLTQKVMQQVNIPIIGIGGGQADGQVLVVDDLLGKNPGFKPKFLRQYADLHTIMTNAINQYVADVKSTDFPNVNEQY
jgi:3-methyl-2-oxobutanoate hydroxymethyltransferase